MLSTTMKMGKWVFTVDLLVLYCTSLFLPKLVDGSVRNSGVWYVSDRDSTGLELILACLYWVVFCFWRRYMLGSIAWCFWAVPATWLQAVSVWESIQHPRLSGAWKWFIAVTGWFRCHSTQTDATCSEVFIIRFHQLIPQRYYPVQ